VAGVTQITFLRQADRLDRPTSTATIFLREADHPSKSLGGLATFSPISACLAFPPVHRTIPSNPHAGYCLPQFPMQELVLVAASLLARPEFFQIAESRRNLSVALNSQASEARATFRSAIHGNNRHSQLLCVPDNVSLAHNANLFPDRLFVQIVPLPHGLIIESNDHRLPSRNPSRSGQGCFLD